MDLIGRNEFIPHGKCLHDDASKSSTFNTFRLIQCILDIKIHTLYCFHFLILQLCRGQCGGDRWLFPGRAVVQCGLGQDIPMWEPALGGWASPAEVQAQPLLHRARLLTVCPGGQQGRRAYGRCREASAGVRGGLG